MHHFRKKSSSSTPTNSRPYIPIPRSEHTKRESSTPPRVEDQRPLSASSSANALSIASASHNPSDTVLDEPGSSKELAWKTAYGAAKIAIETPKESSDMFLPLKAVVGALSVLVKSYNQTIANAEQINDIEERMESLSEILAFPADDQDTEENTRRTALRKKLVRIVTELRPLSEQHGIAKFLKNAEHAERLNGFVQDLAYAVADYQTSIQQSIHENTKEIKETATRTDRTTERIDETTRRIEEATRMIEEAAKRSGGATKRIGEATQGIHDTAKGFGQMTEEVDHTTNKVDENIRAFIETADLELLGKLEAVKDAGHQAGHHDRCLRKTRESVLGSIMRWARDPHERHVFWLNGLAGTGKSTIAQTFSEMVAQEGILGASFFCSRDYLDRRELKNIFPTLAYQLACQYPELRRRLIRVIKQDPSVAHSSLMSQLNRLIVGPLSSTGISCIIVIDALDECVDDQPSSAILSVLGRHVNDLQLVKFFITGRPELRIRSGFRLPLLEPLTQVFLLHEVELSSVDKDIRLYLREKLTSVAKQRSDLDLPDAWPCDDDLTALTKKSSGLFIFASTLVRFIESEHHEPKERLRLITTLPDNTVHEGRAGIDPLYTRVLTHAFSGIKETTVFANLRRVLGTVVLAFNPLSRAQISKILVLDVSLIATTLRHLHSVLLIPNEDSKAIRVFHKSFPDFLQDPDRCSDSRFLVDPTVHHGDMALGCLELLKKLKPNPCDLPDFVMNQDVANLPRILEDKVGSATRYACGYWAMHVRSSPTTRKSAIRLIASATEFFKNNALPWIEIMSLENRLGGVIHNIHSLLDWLATVDVSASKLRGPAQDCLRFIMHFFHLIRQSARHIYHSALPLAPRSSPLRSIIPQQKVLVAEFYGCSEAWGAAIQTIKSSSGRFTHMTTFASWIAGACDDGVVGVYESATGALRLSLNPGDLVKAMRGTPDGSTLLCAHQQFSVTAWDIQTGGLMHTFVPEQQVEDIAVSLTGRYLACGLSDGPVKIWEVTNKSEVFDFESGSPVTHLCWLEQEEQLVVTSEASVRVWDVIIRKALRSLVLEGSIRGVVYSQKLHTLAIVTTSEADSIITLVDSRTRTPFIRRTSRQMSCFTFSQITKELVCGTSNPGLQLFSVPACKRRRFYLPATITSVAVLPNGTAVANVTGTGIQLLDLEMRYTPPRQPTASILTVHAFDEGNIIAIVPINLDRITLLESATMSLVLTIPARTHMIPTDLPPILCASLKHRIAFLPFQDSAGAYLEMWRFGSGTPAWTVPIRGTRFVGGMSPSGSLLVVLRDYGSGAAVEIRNTEDGRNMAVGNTCLDWPSYPLEVRFKSETEFYSCHDTYHVPFILSPPTSDKCSITRGEQQPLDERPQRHYNVDDARGWVVGSSNRICWIPPGYIGSGRRCHWWAGDTLIMFGQDGVLRKLTFRKLT